MVDLLIVVAFFLVISDYIVQLLRVLFGQRYLSELFKCQSRPLGASRKVCLKIFYNFNLSLFQVLEFAIILLQEFKILIFGE